jgi:hypothetical protein
MDTAQRRPMVTLGAAEPPRIGAKQLSQWSVKKPRVIRQDRRVSGADIDLMAKRQIIAINARTALQTKFKSVTELEPNRIRLLEKDLSIHLRFVESALLTDAPSVYFDFLLWNTWSAPSVAPVDGFTAEIVDALSAATPTNLAATI